MKSIRVKFSASFLRSNRVPRFLKTNGPPATQEGPIPSVPKFFLEDSKSGIDLPPLVLPGNAIVEVVDIAQPEDIPRTHYKFQQVELRSADQRYITLFKRRLRIVHQMLILVQHNAELRPRKKTYKGDRPEAEQHRNAEIVQLSFHIIDPIGINGAEPITGAVVGLVEHQLGLDPPVRCKIDLRKSTDGVTEVEFLAKGFAIDLKEVGAGLDTQVKTLGLRLNDGKHKR
jgi:hypothetical protein